ncbi:MAG: M20/M25/M40 family metallo-hydrolase [Oscillospiraceae bacterium]
MIFWVVALAIVVAFLAVVLVRASAFKAPDEPEIQPDGLTVDSEHAVDSLAAMIRCRTISSRDRTMRDEREFEKFRNLLKERYPAIHKTCSLERIDETGLLYKWQGKSSQAPVVLMAHYDVVPVQEESWEKPPFEGVIEDGVLWGRGTLDTKGTLCGVVEAAESLINEGFTPENDIYFAFGGDEEIAGPAAPAIVAELEKRGIVPALVVDEGGAVVEGIFPGVSDKCALIGTGEKGMLDVKLVVNASGGHASAPPPHGPLGKLSQAVINIENHPFPAKLTRPVAEMFDTLGRRSSFLYRMIFANLWCFMPLLNAMCKKAGGELNAMMRTTFAATMASGSAASNVLPNTASIGGNMRLIGGDTIESVVSHLKELIKDEDIVIETNPSGMNPSISSDSSCEGYAKVAKAIRATWPGAVVSPYLMVACSDSRHYCRITDKVMRFSAMELEKIATTVAFYVRLIKQC